MLTVESAFRRTNLSTRTLASWTDAEVDRRRLKRASYRYRIQTCVERSSTDQRLMMICGRVSADSYLENRGS
jgi:hypothetical protein